ncbi:MAG: hypothetical protein AAFY46_09820 [Planctomycetota bacterium]
MAYPLAVIYSFWLFRGLLSRTPVFSLVKSIALTGTGTLVLAALAYSPAWALRTGQSPIDVIGSAAQPASSAEGWLRLDELLYNLGAAWAQWTAPLSTVPALGLLVLVLVGLLAWLANAGSGRALAMGVVLGSFGVYVLSGLTPPPWWILVWIVPLVAMAAVTPIVLGLSRWLPERFIVVPVSAVLSGVAAGGTLLSDYPDQFPYRNGMRDAPEIVEALLADGIDRAEIVTISHWYRLLNFEFEKRGERRGVVKEYHPALNPSQRYFIDIRASSDTRWGKYNALNEGILSRLRLLDSRAVEGAIIDRYRVVESGP